MKVGVYVDGFNVYFGGRSLCGRGTAGWRWLDLRSLAEDLVAARTNWVDATVDRVVYCTALIDGATNTSGRHDQDTYIRALKRSNAIDHIEFGKYVDRVKTAPLATKGPKERPEITTSTWPVMVQSANGKNVNDARFIVSYAHREEKGSDVNVASHLLFDVLTEAVDAAVVFSNDSDLRYPIQQARERVPVGTVNPSKGRLAGDLQGDRDAGVGRHWWRQLDLGDFRRHQLPDPAGGVQRPKGW